MSENELQKLLVNNETIRKLSKHALVEPNGDYINSLASLEDISGSLDYNEVPTGSLYEKANELNKIIAGRQAGILLETIKSAKAFIEEFSDVGVVEFRQPELDAINEKLNMSMKSQSIPQFHTLPEQTRQNILERLQKTLNLSELPSIDIVNTMIEMYNQGAPKNVIKNKLGVVLQINNEELTSYNEENEKVLSEPLIKYVYFRLKEFNNFIKELDFHNEIKASEIRVKIDSYLATVSSEHELNSVLQDVIFKSGVLSLEDVVTTDEVTSENKVDVKSVNQNSINYAKGLFGLANDTSSVDLFLRLNDQGQLSKLFGDTPASKDVYSLSVKYNELLDSLILTASAVALIAKTLKQNLKIVDLAINTAKKLDNLLDDVYNVILECVNGSVSTESFVNDFLKSVPKLTFITTSLDNPVKLNDENVVLKSKVQHVYGNKGVMSEVQRNLFVERYSGFFKDWFNIHVNEMSADELTEFVVNGVDTQPNMCSTRYDTSLTDILNTAYSILSHQGILIEQLNALEKEMTKFINRFIDACDKTINYANVMVLNNFISEYVDGIVDRPLYKSLAVMFKILNVTHIRQMLPFTPEGQIQTRLIQLYETVGTEKYSSSADIKPYILSKPDGFIVPEWLDTNATFLVEVSNSSNKNINKLIYQAEHKIDIITDLMVNLRGEQKALIAKRKMLSNLSRMTAYNETKEIYSILKLTSNVVKEDLVKLIYAVAVCNEVYSMYLDIVKE